MSEEQEKKEIAIRRQHFFRLNLFFLLVFVLFAILIIRLAILQFVEGPTILQQAKDKLGNTPVRIAPIRGNIYDADGVQLAYSTSVQSLYFSIERGFKSEEADEFAAKLKEVFDQYGDQAKSMTIEQIKENMDLTFRKNTRSVPRRIKSGLSKKEVAYISENLSKYDGVDIVEESIRHYDPDTVAVQLVGYLKKFKGSKDLSFYKNLVQDNPLLNYIEEEEVGFDGLEYMFQEQLRGKNGLKLIPIDSMGRVNGEPQVTPPVKGNNLHLTINKEVQMRTEEAIMEQIKILQEGDDPRSKNARTGYAVAMEVKTGNIIAMASMPDYDTNIWEGGGVNNDELNQILFYMVNGTIREVYQPIHDDKERAKHPGSIVPLGSTIKPLTVLVGLNEKLITPTTSYRDTGIFQFGQAGIHRKSIRNAENAVYGPMDPARAIEKSSNPFMTEKIGNAMYLKYKGEEGVQKWDEYMKMFGLGVSTGSGLNEWPGTIEYFNEAKNASTQSALIYASFGQQGRYTTLQLAQYAATLASRGKRMKPLFVSEIKDSDGTVVQKFEPVVLNTADFPESYWDEIEAGMRAVRVTGFDDFPHEFLRKTGTSEQSVAGKIVENSVFIASAPADDPVLAVAVVVPEGGYGSRGAAPIARKIFDAYDKEYGLK
ncbi:penicillin-binding protein 2 [Paenibacillus sp. 1011MAR3C5]|uniref:peptidoglycan D,D-transpeptidase FtsI family protein n=1 Tax=Paenibacillus sp. 1011MAR3C5 TaxID=1675787 RepID=UPI000E6B63C2|nr:penicillin-binding transpeptidase domain-containing protein [Paenibacillus sp. 1011MAR3C5]RJE90330.1 penicillin-binding protein 2 [Paenibacillus sp. 1011MAR3C5]